MQLLIFTYIYFLVRFRLLGRFILKISSKIISVVLLVGASFPAIAQIPINPSTKNDLSALVTARQDTSAALESFFAQQRRENWRILLGSGARLLFFNYGLAYSKSETVLQQVSTGLIAGYSGFQAYTLGRAIIRLRRCRPRREKRLLAALMRGEPLPYRVRLQLETKYFRPKLAAP